MVLVTESGGLVCGSSGSLKRSMEGDVDSLGKVMVDRVYTFVRAVAPNKVGVRRSFGAGIAKADRWMDIVE